MTRAPVRKIGTAGLFALVAALPFAVPAQAAAPRPGVTGPVLTLDSAEDLKGYDVAVDTASGISYVGWIAQNTVAGTVSRTVKLCVLPLNATACDGGLLSTDGLDSSSAKGLRVVLEGPDRPALVWFHDTGAGSVNGPRGGRVAVSRLTGGALSPGADIHDAPSFGQLFDAVIGPQTSNADIWTVTATGAVPTSVEVGAVGNALETVTSPVGLDAVRLAFGDGSNGGPTRVLEGVQYGSVSAPVLSAVAGFPGPFAPFAGVAGTSAPSAGLTKAAGAVRLIASAPNVSGKIVALELADTTWGKPVANGYRYSCPDLGMDVDGEGNRVAYAAYHCANVTVGNFIAGGTRAATVRFPSGGTVTYRPVISGTLGGHTRVAFSIQREGAGGSVLKVASVLLPPVPTTTSAKGSPGRVSLTAPGDCLPPTLGRLKASAKAAKGWRLTEVTLKRTGHKVANPSTIDGSAFGSVHIVPVQGSATFTRHGVTKSLKVEQNVVLCLRP